MSSFARKIKRQAERQSRERNLRAFRADTINLDHEFFSNKKVQIGRTHGKKLSEALLEVIQPYKAMLKVDTFTAMHKLVLLGSVAWTVAIAPEAERADVLRSLLDVLPKADKTVQHDIEEMVWEMVQRKLMLFADDKRVIVNCKVVDEGGHWRVNIASLDGE